MNMLSKNDIGKLIVIYKLQKDKNNKEREIIYKGYLINYLGKVVTVKLKDNGYNSDFMTLIFPDFSLSIIFTFSNTTCDRGDIFRVSNSFI